MAVSKKSAALKAAPKKTTTASKVAEHPTYIDMIKECIIENKDTDTSVSRTTIKKFLASEYKLDMTSNKNISSLNRAIESGTERGIFVLPKGPSGKIGLTKPGGKENVAPTAAKVSHKKGPAAAKAADKAPAKKPLQPTGGSKSRPAKVPAPAKAAPAPKVSQGSKSRPAKPAAAPVKAAPAAKKAAPKKAAAAAPKKATAAAPKKATPAATAAFKKKAVPSKTTKAAPAAKKAAAKTKSSTATKTKTKTSAKAEAPPPKAKRGAPKQRS